MASVVSRWQRHRMAAAFDALASHVHMRGAKRVADGHWLHTRGRMMVLEWRMQAKLQIAVDLWVGNVLRPAFAQWRTVTTRRARLRITAGVVAARWRNLELTGCPQLLIPHALSSAVECTAPGV
uniref:Uncharacterized protein n=1 Tax=Chlamydomonas euryale TaxID=1486919 RepID=A0A7R9VSU1_9CHLO|mmetsp:Transcript_42963/g.128975  ORF Transcript_42963/g.128975 Transcript_42963/m.128975 type:complete len:124 (+) Transcript_42963:1020-1391(+)